ncbi:MAG: glycosyltransferase family 4 protein, partial [Planctomycetota bacterium]
LSGLDIGGKERVALELARLGRAAGRDDRLMVFDSAFRDAVRDLDPGDVPVELIERGAGLDLAFARRAAARLVELRPSAVHAHNDTGIFYGSLARALTTPRLGSRRPRLVATFHARPIHATRGARWSTRAACLAASSVTAVSEDLRSYLRREGWCGRCDVIGNGIDLDRFAPDRSGSAWRERLGISPDVPLIVHLGRLDPIKRHADLIAAHAYLREGGTAVETVAAGDGVERPRVEQAARTLPGFHHLPGVQDVPGLLGEADLLVLCSAFEATPMVVIEALAAGLPVVATDVGGLPAMVAADPSGQAISLVPPEAPERLADAIRALLDEPEGDHQARRAAARAAAQAYDWKPVLARYEALYRVARGTPER